MVAVKTFCKVDMETVLPFRMFLKKGKKRGKIGSCESQAGRQPQKTVSMGAAELQPKCPIIVVPH